ncbi:SUKH-4 family immunity protein [Streptomyces sp. HUAS MG47]|uniref:SUKH-4 family immunity protein n=1 Tax=Streptomyces solicamelliae TaxID=3231716 RepID=UPI003877D1FF
MVTFAQAQERAEEWINGDLPAYQHREVRVREFELGFVVWAEDREDGPTSDGGRQRLVIARDSGEATLWPGLPVGEVIRRYEEEYGASAAARAEAPAPPQRVDLNQTSFLLTPPEWLQEAADRAGIPDGRSADGGASSPSPTPAPAPAPVAGTPPPAPMPASATPPPAPSAPSAGGSGAWADVSPSGGDDVSVPLPATVFAPPLSGADDDDTPPPVTGADAPTALMSGGSQLPRTQIAQQALQPDGMPPGVPQAGPPGGPQGGPQAGSIPPPPPGAPGVPGAPGADAYVPTQLVSQLGPNGPTPPGAPGTPPPPAPPGAPGGGATPAQPVHHAATMLAHPNQSMGGATPPPPPGPPGVPGQPGTPPPPAPPGVPGGGATPPQPVHHAATMLASPSQGGPGTPPPPGPPGVPGQPGTPPPPAPPGVPGGGATPPQPVHHAATMLASPSQGGPGTPPPPSPPPGAPGMPGPAGAAPFPPQPTGQPTVGPGYQAVLRYRAPDGSEAQIIRRSAPGTPHPEWQILHELRAMNVPPQQVLELHTELESCELPGGYCARMIRETWPQARITNIAPYGRDHAGRQQGMQQLLTHQGELHQVADGPARPAPVRAPLPQVPPAPPVPPEGVAQELAGAFGPAICRFDQRAVSRQGVPEVVAVTLVWAGLPADFGPFFWAQPAQPVVPTLAELAAQRQIQPPSDAGSYLVLGSDFGKAICVQYGTAHIVAVPVEPGPDGRCLPPQFVNTGLPEFTRCMALLGRMWRLRFGLTPEQAGRWTVDFQAQLAMLDPAALASPENWWSVLLEQMWDGLL